MDWTGIKIAGEPATEPVTVAELKTYARIDSSAYDTMLGGLITACRKAIEGHSGRKLITQTLEMYLDDFPEYNGEILLPYPPVQSVSSIYYNRESDGVLTLLAASLYRVDSVSLYARITPAYDEDWPDTRAQINNVKISYIAGYGAAAAVPEEIKTAIKAICTDMFEHPEANMEVVLSENRTYKFLLNSFSIPGCV